VINGAERSSMAEEVVGLAGVWKAYGGVVAVRDVSLSLATGEVRALLGENGAGKTTLMNVLYGLVRPDAGRLLVDGREVTGAWSPRRAIAHGIGMIHQHFALVGEHTVLENVVMPVLRWHHLRPDWRGYRPEVERLGATYGLTLALDARVEALSVGERQQVEILKLLLQRARVLVLDEPTGVLTPQQTEALLAMLTRLRERGHTVVLATHKLREAFAVSTRITVLRQGEHVATLERAATTPEEVARLMVSQESRATGRVVVPPRREIVLELRDLEVDGADGRMVDGVSLTVRAGEILGVAGVAGNGQTQLAEALLGYRPARRGCIRVGGVDLTGKPVGDRLRHGLAFIPEDRHELGLVLDLGVADNMVLDRAGDRTFCRLGILRRDAIRAYARERIAAYDVRTPGPDAPARQLSGGNQQKLVLSRALARDPRVIIASEPTRGLDFAATAYVRGTLAECATRGVAILLVSSDLEELMELCHRIAVMYRGRVVGVLDQTAFDVARLGRLMGGLAA
jgi:general nucleoside transport system ATP-binding protein